VGELLDFRTTIVGILAILFAELLTFLKMEMKIMELFLVNIVSQM